MNKEVIKKLKIGTQFIEYKYVIKDVKNINMHIRRTGEIYVSAPSHVPYSVVENFLIRKSDMILSALESCRHIEVKKSIKYVDGEIIKLLGKDITLRVHNGDIDKIIEKYNLRGEIDELILVYSGQDSYERKNKLFNSWLKEYTINIFEKINDKMHVLFQDRYSLRPKISIKKMKTRWGSCSPGKNKINLNSKLIEAPIQCIEYVVAHEYTHFIQPNHSKLFYNELSKVIPNWKELKELLNKKVIF